MDYEKSKRYFELKEPDYRAEDAEALQGKKQIVFYVLLEIVIAVAYFSGKLDFIFDIILSIPYKIGAIILIFGWLVGAGYGALKLWSSQRKRAKKENEYNSLLVTDKEYDRMAFEPTHNVKAEALEHLGLDEDEIKDADPIVFSSYKLQDWTKAKKGEDGYWRTDSVECIFLCFSAQAVHCFTLRYNTLMQKKKVSTDVFFYGDIAAISTTSETITMGIGDSSEEVNFDSFSLKTTGGLAFSIALRDRASAMQSISAMRNLIHEKKKK